jgi:hypothetical protein
VLQVECDHLVDTQIRGWEAKAMQESKSVDHTALRVWVFQGEDLPERRSYHPSAVFSSIETASAWLGKHRLSGLLTSYVVDEPAFERSLRLGTVPDRQKDGKLRQVWGGGEEHFHVEEGRIGGTKI